MIRVGFAVANAGSWVGGLVYLRNLIAAVMAMPDRRTEPVLIAGPDTPPEHLTGFDGVDVLRTPLVARGRPERALRRFAQSVLGRDPAFEAFLIANRIDVLSHSGFLGRRSRVPAIAWLPDFQHVRMPGFFTDTEVTARNGGYARTAQHAQVILLSSEDARGDLSRFAPDSLPRAHVLRFMAGLVGGDTASDGGAAVLAERYAIDRPYFYLPNQFWAHKNHRLVVDALALLAREGDAPLVVSTGKTEDRRNPEHFAELMAHAAAAGVTPHFRVLGLVDYADLPLLYAHAVAVINPSKFEGWSTTVEEAKSLGKAVILSDIPVHREQAPVRGRYVPVDDPRAMADAMRATLAEWNARIDLDHRQVALAQLAARRAEFARQFESIVISANESYR